MVRKKILNDPVYGFISISSDLILQVIDHPFFQRLRRIKQLGFSDYVYPGAHHTRFHHSIGAMHLMGEALKSLREKGVEITDEEYEAAQLAILLHDVGHGPFSHALEHSILKGVHHETISLAIMNRLNEELKPEPVVLLSGKVLNKKTNEPLQVDISYEDLETGKEIGGYYFKL